MNITKEIYGVYCCGREGCELIAAYSEKSKAVEMLDRLTETLFEDFGYSMINVEPILLDPVDTELLERLKNNKE